MLVIDSADNNSRNQVLIKNAKARGQKIIFYPVLGKKITSEGIKNVLAKTRFETLILAGHSGNGSFSGSKGDINREDILAGLSKNEYSRKNCHELLTLGCNTSTKNKVAYYKGMFDNLKILHGYSGSAPLSHRKNAISYVNEFFENSNKLQQAKSKEEVEAIIATMDATNDVNSGIFLKCDAEEYFISHEEENSDPTKVEEFILEAGCEGKVEEFIQNFKPGMNDFFSGQKDPDEDEKIKDINGDSFLRRAYTFINRNEQCLEDLDIGFGFSVRTAMMLLFNKAFRANYTTYYKPLFAKSLKELDAFDTKEKISKFLNESFDKKIASIQKCLNQIHKCEANQQKLILKYRPEKDEYDRLIAKEVLSEAEFNLMTELRAKSDLHDQLLFMGEADLKDMLKSATEAKRHLNKYVDYYTPAVIETRVILKKFVMSPDKISRKDMVRFSDITQRISFDMFSEGLGAATNDIIPGGYNLDSPFPFSWHEKKSFVQEPSESFLKLESLMSQVGSNNLEREALKEICNF